MRKYLLPENGNFYKANLHCHTTVSDGRCTPEQVKDNYKIMGYSIVAYTDHDVLISHSELNDPEFLALNGFEVEITEPGVDFTFARTCHICFIALEPDNLIQPCWHRSAYQFGNAVSYRDKVQFDDTLPDYVREFNGKKISEMMHIARDKGFYVTYNHPTWSLEDYSNYIEYEGMHAFEMFNGGCLTEGYDDYNPRVYDDILRSGKKIYCIGADDNHNAHPMDCRHWDSGLAYTVIKAPELEYKAITTALENGDFYASQGPEIYNLWYEDGVVHIECSEADRIDLSTGVRFGMTIYHESSDALTQADIRVPDTCNYFRLTVTDKQGNHACTNAYFIEDLKD